MINKMRYIGTFIGMFILLISCIHEDRSNCHNLSLSLKYFGDGNKDIFSSKIDKVDIFLYDDQNLLLKQRNVSSSELKIQNLKLNLKPGKYKIIACANTHSNTSIVALPDFYDSYITHPNIHKDNYDNISGADRLYIGTQEFWIKPEVLTFDTIYFKSSHYKVYIEIKGLKRNTRVEDAGIQLHVDNIPSRINFENIPCGDFVSCNPITKYFSNDYMAETVNFQIPRSELNDKDDETMRIYNMDNDLIVEKSLAEFVAENPEIDLSKQEVIIPISVEFTPISVIIRLPEWFIQDVKPELQ